MPVRVTPAGRIEVVGSVGSSIYSFLIDSGSGRTVLAWAIKEERIRHAFGGIIGEVILCKHEAILDIGGRALHLKPSRESGTYDRTKETYP